MNSQDLTIALLPLDERPVNTRYPLLLAKIAGAHLLLPPNEIMGWQRKPADLASIGEWLKSVAPETSAMIVSADFLAYGNLINARISNDSAIEALSQIAILQQLGSIPIHVFSLITRVANADDNVEEPLYWKNWGTKFYRYARLEHMSEVENLSDEDSKELAAISSQLPADLKSDWLTRRLRNHTVNLALIDLAARVKVSSLLLTSDDTSQFGFPTRERNWLKSWTQMIGLAALANIQMHPGADEVGSALVAKLVNQHAGVCPKILIHYSNFDDRENIAPYEDRPVWQTVEGQIDACGCAVALHADDADIVLGVVTPSPHRKDYRPEYLDGDRATRGEGYREFLAHLAEFQNQSKSIAIADVAYPNGSDPLMSEMLLAGSSPIAPGSLCAYGAWNTAGNTLGVVVAQAACSLLTLGNVKRVAAQERFLMHRFLEDYGYQQVVRRQAREYCEAKFGTRDPNPESEVEVEAVARFIESKLLEIVEELYRCGIGLSTSLVPGSVRLPWNRTFEVDFEIETV